MGKRWRDFIYISPVRGWLLVFCFILLLVIPYLLLKSSVVWLHAADTLKSDYPRAELMSFLHSFLSVVMIVLSIRAFYQLWHVSPQAVFTAKRFLVILWVVSVILALLPFTIGLPAAASAKLLRSFLWESAKSSAYCGFWWLYLHRSKRVRATYGTGAAA